MCYDNVEETGTKDENSSIPTTTFDHWTWDSTTSLIVERELRHLERYIHLHTHTSSTSSSTTLVNGTSDIRYWIQ